MAVLLDVRDIAFAYDERLVLDGVSFSLQPREVVGLVGPNGSGKSTLLHLLLGLHTVQRGTISLDETPLYTHSRKELAKRIALVPQETALEFTFAVRDIVAMGRNPHLGRFRPETVTDAEAIRWALEHTETAHLAARSVHTLSGGERRRVFIARALAQQPQLFLLDEPTANLDLSHQLETLALVRTLAQEGRCALIALHDLALAVRFCDRILLLSGGRIAAQGCPEEVITEAHLATYFGIRARIRRDEETGVLLVVPLAPTASCDTTTRITPYC